MNNKAQTILTENWLEPSEYPMTGRPLPDHPRDGGALLVDQDSSESYTFYDMDRAVRFADEHIDHDNWNVFFLDLRL